MAKNKSLKWIVGLSSVSSVVAIFYMLAPNDEQSTTLPKFMASFNQSERDERQTVPTLEEVKQQEQDIREEWIASLDWEEGNWDVNHMQEGIMFTPVQEREGLPPADTRTRRS